MVLPVESAAENAHDFCGARRTAQSEAAENPTGLPAIEHFLAAVLDAERPPESFPYGALQLKFLFQRTSQFIRMRAKSTSSAVVDRHFHVSTLSRLPQVQGDVSLSLMMRFVPGEHLQRFAQRPAPLC